MPLPTMNDVMRPCLVELQKGASNARECLPGLKARFGLGDEDMEDRIPSGTRTRIFDRADWAIFHMMKAGLIDRPKRGVYVLSEAGDRFLSTTSDALTLTDLKTYPAYSAWQSGAAKANEQVVAQTVGVDETRTLTPSEAMEAADAELQSALENDILEAVLGIDPTRFEQLIIDLLLAMDYGDGKREMGERLGKSSDGGIDGVINEDPLGLDAVYI